MQCIIRISRRRLHGRIGHSSGHGIKLMEIILLLCTHTILLIKSYLYLQQK